MPHFAANLTMMFNEVPFLDRFAAARNAGFDAVEFLFPYAHSPSEVGARLTENGLTQALFNAPPGDWDAGERGIAALPDRVSEFRQSIDRALEYARALNCKTLHVMAGLVGEADDRDAMMACYIENVRYAADQCRGEGMTVALEPLNARDVPGYLIGDLATVARAIDMIDRANVGIQFDFYHAQITGGDLARRFEQYLPKTVHVQIAGVPERYEPNTGEVNYPYLFLLMDRLGYEGYVGCEYKPRGHTLDGLGWLFD